MLLLPLRLEYRYVGGKERFATVDHAAVDALRRDPTLRQRKGQRGPVGELVLQQGEPSKADAEILFRWFPDEAFALEAVPPMSEEEGAALEVFSKAIKKAGVPWHDTTSSSVRKAWATLGETVELHRALTLLRRGTPEFADDWQDAAGKIVALPRRVVLYSVKGSAEPQLLAKGSKITGPLRYTPKGLHVDSWLMSFDAAVAGGMGLRLGDEALVAQALRADWIFAVGVGQDEGAVEVASLFDNAQAHGRLEILPQDAPTNNTDGAPSGYSAKVTDLAATLEAATYDRRSDDEPRDTDADRLASALGLDLGQAYRTAGASRRGVSHAETMATVLLPALLEGKFDRGGNDGTRRLPLYRFLRRYAFARGPLPAIRLGHSPFGVLPVAPYDQLEAAADIPQADRKAFDFVKQVSAATLEAQSERVGSVPVLEPGAADAAQRLEEILQLNPVSKRVDVLELRELDTRFIGCPYVQSKEHDPSQYLVSLASRPLATLPDPSSKERQWPLLYRLARRSRQLLETSEAWSGGKGPGEGPSPLRPALLELSERSPEELEILMMEVLDLLRFRADAWATALATCRLDRQRRGGSTGLGCGYYGVLSKLRKRSTSSATDGYVQAPGIAQAVTAGLLRSASLRYSAEGAFDIDLSSRRTRRATKVLEGLRQGLTLREVLGLRTERWIHDRGTDVLIHELRRIYPLATGSSAIRSHLVDGLAFAEGKGSDLAGLDAGLRSTAADARAATRNDLDALSDLVMAEAVHQLAKGNSGAANAWVQVLSGEPPPTSLQFLRSHRAGHGSTHRVALLLRAKERSDAKHPRALVEPRLADLAATVLEDFERCRVGVELAGSDAEGVRLDLSLADDLGMQPVDLLIGGKSEVQVRARFHVLRLWSRDKELLERLGPLPDGGLMAFLRDLPMTLDVGPIAPGPALETLLARGAWLRALMTKARPLEPTDLNAARPVDEALGDGGVRRLLGGSLKGLHGRARALRDGLRAVRRDLATRVEQLVDEVKRALTTENPSGDPLAAVERARRRFDGALVEASRFGLPDALRPYATGELLVDLESLRARWTKIEKRLGGKIRALRSVLEETLDSGSRSALAAAVERAVVALQSAVDGEAMPVWPPFEHTAETEPLLEETDLTVDEAIGDWRRVRPRLRAVARIGQELPDLRVYRVAAKATASLDDDPDSNARTEAERPRSYYYGTFLAEEATWEGNVYGGVVFDEWSEQRPSTQQPTALAVNVDAPQSEPPHTLLLGVAGERQTGPWTPNRAVELVRETVRLMQTRALPSTGMVMEGSGMHFFNLIEGKGKGGVEPRIPVQSTAFERITGRLVDLVEVDDIPDLSRTARGLKER